MMLPLPSLSLSKVEMMKKRSYEALALNCWYAPGFNLEHIYTEMKRNVNANGGALDPMYLYLDHESADRWCRLVNEDDYNTHALSGDLINWIADEVLFYLKDDALNKNQIRIIGLGCGDGKNETELTWSLLNKRAMNMELYLFDCSPYLTHMAFDHATKILGKKKEISIHAVEGNFERLHDLPFLFHSPLGTRQLRVGCLFGNSLGNLSNELHFVEDSLSAFHQGDLLIMDVGLAYAPADQPEEVKRKDPRLSSKEGWYGAFEQWMRSPLEQHRRGYKSIQLQSAFDNRTCPVPGSYSVVVQANIDNQATITLVRIRRYEQEQLNRSMYELGWRSLGGKIFGPDNHRLLCVFERM